MPRDEFDRRTNAELVCRGLHQLDIPAAVNSRHDLVIGDKKVSGSAYKLVNARAYHHGTMLIDSDLKALGRYLKPPPVTIVLCAKRLRDCVADQQRCRKIWWERVWKVCDLKSLG